MTTPPTGFVLFSQNLAHMIYMPMCKKTGTDFQHFDFKILAKILFKF